jgi:predicted membrane channel-forming protein YqfA (hemolysin III family)
MVKRIAREWLWLLGAVLAATGLSLIIHGAFWRVGETGVALVSLYGLSVLVRTTMWAVRNARGAGRSPAGSR